MPHRLRWLVLCGWLLLTLAGCANSTTYHLIEPPCASPTPTGGTGTCEPVVITTDRTVYVPSDRIQVTITNQFYTDPRLHVAVLLLAPAGSCAILRAERWQRNGWEDVPVCSTSTGGGGESGGAAVTGGTGHMTVTRIIERGTAYDMYLTARNTVLDAAHHTLFPVGIYHLVVQYALRVDGGSYGINRLDGGEDGFTLYSQPFGVCMGGVCS